LIFLSKLLYSIDLRPAESAAILQPNGIEPEFSFVLITFNMHMRRLITISGVKEESIGANL
jgi:hypothetical protein